MRQRPSGFGTRFPLSLVCLDGKDGKLRAEQFAIVAVEAVIGFDHGRMISFCIKRLGNFEDLPWTIRDTIPAALASFLYYVHRAPFDFDFMGIKGNPPVFHKTFLEMRFHFAFINA